MELASIYMLANTPNSLFLGLRGCSTVADMINNTPRAELLAYYDRITSRARRTEIVMALSYAVLLAILCCRDRTNWNTTPDATRLTLGQYFEDESNKACSATTIEHIAIDIQNPHVTFHQAAGTSI